MCERIYYSHICDWQSIISETDKQCPSVKFLNKEQSVDTSTFTFHFMRQILFIYLFIILSRNVLSFTKIVLSN